MTDLRQAAQMALDAWDDPAGMKDLCVAMDALRTALEQQQAEPPSEWPLIKNILDEYGLQAISFVAEWKAAQQQADPVGEVIDERGEVDYISYVPPVGTALYTTPPQRQWVGLTNEEIGQIILQQEITLKNYVCVDKQTEFARAIEAKLKERNHD